MSDLNVKIVKKHLRSNGFNDDVYILQYKHSLFTIEYWKEFPIYFTDEDTLKDFIETAVAFDSDFNKFKNDDSLFYYRYKYSGKKYDIVMTGLKKVLKYYVFYSQSEFKIIEDSDRLWNDNNVSSTGRLLSNTYNRFISQYPTGLSDALEEKTYKLVQE